MFQFRKLEAAPEAAVTITVYYKGTTDLVPNLIDFNGDPLDNPFAISDAGGADHWWFDSTNRAVVDILWTEEARIIAKGDVIGGEVYRGTALPTGADPADYPLWWKTDEDPATVSITSTPEEGNTSQGISAHWAESHEGIQHGTTAQEQADIATGKNHAGATGNPHGTTPADIGAATSGHSHPGVYDPAGTATAAVGAHAAGVQHGTTAQEQSDITANNNIRNLFADAGAFDSGSGLAFREAYGVGMDTLLLLCPPDFVPTSGLQGFVWLPSKPGTLTLDVFLNVREEVKTHTISATGNAQFTEHNTQIFNCSNNPTVTMLAPDPPSAGESKSIAVKINGACIVIWTDFAFVDDTDAPASVTDYYRGEIEWLDGQWEIFLVREA